MSDSTVAAGKVVGFHYTLTGPDGATIDSSDGGNPMLFLVGAHNIVPGLERQLLGKQVGDGFVAQVPCAEAYGEKREGAQQEVPRTAFPPDVDLQPGMQFMGETPDGQPFPLWVLDSTAETVTITQDHPLAGVDLTFDVRIESVREPSQEEVAHGHPHGPGGAH